ncbi:NAD-dependent epimerase [Echinicola marina]|uniref:NAD-dependent epimerase n=1 Tax=Echinicola marina TaxID=2859768 RepID=UPI001CF6736B|nr:NAD-dependent epimerase [Echinicola marina]UCS95623.1 NAD-dependent epimerase [Echinicola marina]
MKFLVTGAAGFIGFALAKRLLEEGHEVVGLDSINDYYDVNLKYGRLADLGLDITKVKSAKGEEVKSSAGFSFYKMKLEDSNGLMEIFAKEKFDIVVNLAAQAGVRYSLENPMAYIDANIVGFINVLEACRHFPVKHLVYASSSSVYGANKKIPFSSSDNVDHPVSLYAATKKSNELMAHTYSHLYGIPTTGLRFFTVYGPWGRPDMAMFLFTDAIVKGRPLKVFNQGEMQRDFTYIDDIVEGVYRVSLKIPEVKGTGKDTVDSQVPYKIYNIGNSKSVNLMDFIKAIEKELGKKAILDMQPMQAGDVPVTYADVSELANDTGYQPNTAIEKGVSSFVSWYKDYYGL